MSVLDLCDREIAAVGLEATVADAIHKMLDHHVGAVAVVDSEYRVAGIDRKSTRLNSSHLGISYAVFCLKKKKTRGSACSAARPVGRPTPPRRESRSAVSDLPFFF